MHRVLFALAALLFLWPAAAQAAAPTLSVTDRLDDRRFAAIGTRAYEVGTEAGRYPAMGFHTRGEMGGVWAPPIKLLDGVWFGVDGQWIGPATRFTSGYGHVQMALPGREGLTVARTDVVPDGRRGVLIGLTFTSTGARRRLALQMDAHSELMSSYPWGETPAATQLQFNLPDAVASDGRRLLFTDKGTPPVANAPAHEWAAAVGSTSRPTAHETGDGYRGPQQPAPVICPATGTAPPRCDDTAYGKGKGGRLTYAVDVPAGGRRTLWFGVAGSDTGPAGANAELGRLLADPAKQLAAKVVGRERVSRWSRLDLPGDPLLAQGADWTKQMLADAVQDVRGLQLRETNAGTAYPPPKGTLARARWLGAGWPDYPWMFGTDGEYTAFASVALGQFEPIADHLRALRDVSRTINGGTGKVVHEVVYDGSVYFGANADAGNTDETVKLPSAVALVWRWTGDTAFRDEMYAFARDGMRYVFRELDADRDGWPEGLGNVEREGMGPEKLDNTVYAIRGLYDLADMAQAKGDAATLAWASRKAADLERRFESAWWMPGVPQHADSLGQANEKIQQRHWIGATPMEVELTRRAGLASPGLTTAEHAAQALDLRETSCYGDASGMFHTGAPGCDGATSDSPPDQEAFTLNTAVAAVAEGNYGRLGRDQQQRWTTANRQLQLPVPDEQPGAMPEIAPGPANGPTIDRPFNERPQVVQSWGAYGLAWPVVHQQLGVRPDLGRGRLEVVPQLPQGQRSVAGRQIRLGSGSVDVAADRRGDEYRTTVDVVTPLARLELGHTLPVGTPVREVRLDGRKVGWRSRVTNRGLEVTVRVKRPDGEHRVEVATR